MKVEYGPPAPGGVQQLLAMGDDTLEPGMITVARNPPGFDTIRKVARYGTYAWLGGKVLGMRRVSGLGRVAALGALGVYYYLSEMQRGNIRTA